MGIRLRHKEMLDGEQFAAMLGKSPAHAAQGILAAAAQNVVQAQTLLGQILLDGHGIERDEALARRWFEIAANQGDAMARNMFGRCLEHGWGGAANASAAAQHYRIAAEAGLDWGLYNFANLLATGRGIAQDNGLALTCYRRAAEMGHAKSMNLLGRYLEEGLHCAVDRAAAADWYRRSAEAGDFRGQFSHAAVLVDQGHIEQAIVWLRKALAEGNVNFLRVSSQALLQAGHAQIRALAEDYRTRLLELERQA
ncbi:tetratricopeptide repeat protein [Pseudomonas akapageensis]|uniref:tetratricopeptide repeat protein n=1 Tax=Pseudomonas akapageensis TaxID=2609961 RepID=UPI001408EDD3